MCSYTNSILHLCSFKSLRARAVKRELWVRLYTIRHSRLKLGYYTVLSYTVRVLFD